MRLLLLIGISSALVLPASASEKMTVSQLEGILAQHAAHLPQTAKMVKPGAPEEIGEISDGDLLQQLDQDDELLPKVAGIELTERLSTLTMYRFVSRRTRATGTRTAGGSLRLIEAASGRTDPSPAAGCSSATEDAPRVAFLRAARVITLAEFHGNANDNSIRRFPDGHEIFPGNSRSSRSSSSWIRTAKDHFP